VADLPIDLKPDLAERLTAVLDVEDKLGRALDSLGPLRDRRILVVDGLDGTGSPGLRARRLREMGAQVEAVGSRLEDRAAVPDGSVDAIVGFWSSFRGDDPAELTDAARVARPGGRLLVVHDYGRDDVARLRGDLPEHGRWSHRGGPFLGQGFKVRVVHCWWTFGSTDEMRDFLAGAFGDRGTALADRLTRPRISYNLAVYHRTMADAPS
jgi:hypothetical protein